MAELLPVSLPRPPLSQLADCPRCGSNYLHFIPASDMIGIYAPPKIECLDCGLRVRGEVFHLCGCVDSSWYSNKVLIERWNKREVWIYD